MKLITSLATAVVVLGCAGYCRADSMTYSTTGVFTGTGASGNVLTFSDGDDIVWDNIPSTTITVPSDGSPGNLSYGMFDTNGVGSATSSVPAGDMFTLTVTQTAPTSNGFTDTATISGTISSTGSTIKVLFPTLIFALGPDFFTIAQPTSPDDGFLIVAPNDNSGFTTVNGTVAINPTPEPTTMLLLGGALISLSLIRRKRSV